MMDEQLWANTMIQLQSMQTVLPLGAWTHTPHRTWVWFWDKREECLFHHSWADIWYEYKAQLGGITQQGQWFEKERQPLAAGPIWNQQAIIQHTRQQWGQVLFLGAATRELPDWMDTEKMLQELIEEGPDAWMFKNSDFPDNGR